MPKPNLHQKLRVLLLLFLFATICNGQVKIKRSQSTGYSQVGCSLLDKAGNLWFGTPNEGVYRYNGKVFSQFSTQNGLANNDLSAIIEDKTGNILIGTKGGICKYDGKSFAPYTDTNDPSKKPISSLFEDKEGHLWFGVWGQGLYQYDGKTFTNFLYQYEHPFYGNKQEKLIIDIIQDKNGNMWFSSWNGGGVWRYDPSAKLSADGKAFKNFLPSLDYYKTNQDKRSGNTQNLSLFLNNSLFTQSKDYIADDMIFSMTEDKSGNIWFATRNHGVCRFDGKIFKDFGTKEGFLSTNAYAILEDKKGNMWFTTEKDGVWRYDGKTFKNFTTKDGLVNDSVFSILEDKNGNLWFGTRGFGLCSYNGKIFTNYSE